jgi:hypothetical protein
VLRRDWFSQFFGGHHECSLDGRLFLDLQNLTNRKNPEELIYNFDFSRGSTISGLPTLAVAGARMDF